MLTIKGNNIDTQLLSCGFCESHQFNRDFPILIESVPLFNRGKDVVKTNITLSFENTVILMGFPCNPSGWTRCTAGSVRAQISPLSPTL